MSEELRRLAEDALADCESDAKRIKFSCAVTPAAVIEILARAAECDYWQARSKMFEQMYDDALRRYMPVKGGTDG